jgi:biotin carboxyl carrier protein
LKRFRIALEDRSYEVVVENPDANPVRVTVDGEVFEIPLESLDGAPGAQTQSVASLPIAARPMAVPFRAEPGAVSGHIVRAPMPGTINKLSVKPGDQVEHGQELCVLEAMKMNNVIRATRPARVAEVRVSEKQSVQHGDVLIVFAD